MYKAIPAVVCFLLLIACGQKPANNTGKNSDSTIQKPINPDSARKGFKPAQAMYVVRNTAFDSFALRVDDSMYFCSYKGRMFSADSLGKGRHFLFDLKTEYLIDNMYFRPIGQSRFFIAWQQTDHTGIRSFFAVFNRGDNTPVWKSTSAAPSPGVPVLDSNVVYVSTLGMIGKLNLKTGEEIWRHDSLFDQFKLTYKFFNKPLIYPHTVCFFDNPIRGKKGKSDSIWVDDNSGKIIPRPTAK